MKKNDIITVKTSRYIITPESKNAFSKGQVETKEVLLQVVVDKVGTSTIKGHYLNESDNHIQIVSNKYDEDGVWITDYVITEVVIDKDGNLYEYKVMSNHLEDYYECIRKMAEAKALKLKKYSSEWWQYLGRSFITVAEPTYGAFGSSHKRNDGILVA